MAKEIKFEEIFSQNYDEVIVTSWGYTERGILNSHFEPFSEKREFRFMVNKEFKDFEHDWLFFENPQEEHYYVENNKVYCDAPELWARP